MEKNINKNNRRNFLKAGIITGGVALAGLGISKILSKDDDESGEKIKVLTQDGNLVEVDKSHVGIPSAKVTLSEHIREGVPGRRFIMVIDLSKCGNERKCIEGCQKMHNMLPPVEWIKVKKMQATEITSPYWFPQPCYQCDNPPCTKVCPVDATFKRKDGIVAIDNDRCIGCKFCMAACPYSARTFNFGRPEQVSFFEKNKNKEGTCHTGNANMVGTVSKCDFCSGDAEKGILPACITECPNGALYYGDENEDAVTNGELSFKLSELLKNRSGYRHLEELGTKPRVYYLPPVNRDFPFEEAKEKHNQMGK